MAMVAPPAQAQSLSSGDYEHCAVYRPDGSRAGYSNACLERQRAAIRRYSQQNTGGHGYGHAVPAYTQSGYPCLSWANNGRGFSSTTQSGGYGVRYGTFNSAVNGQPCTPDGGNQFLRGVNQSCQTGPSAIRQLAKRHESRTVFLAGEGDDIMRLAIATILATAGLLSPGASHGSIPPPYAIHLVSSDNESRALGDTLIQYMSTAGAFSRHLLAGVDGQAAACLAEADFETCVRQHVPARRHWQEPAPMIVRVESAGPGNLALTCVGSGAYRPPTADQRVQIDVQAALFGEGDERTDQLRAALTCLRGAALESSAP